jgi:hypothetical protein
MPFDTLTYAQTNAARPDLSKPSLEGLSWILRHQMPKGHRWDFTKIMYREDSEGCGTAGCAFGIALMVWPELEEQYWDQIAEALGTVAYFTTRLFSAEPFLTMREYGVPPEAVTAAMVADKIDAHLRDKAALNAAREISFAAAEEKA